MSQPLDTPAHLGAVLMVEPNPGILIVARNVLARAGFEVVAVAGAREALVVAQRRSVDVVLIDAQHAEPEVLSVLNGNPRVPVSVVLTVQKGRDSLGVGHPTGPDRTAFADVVEKPFTPERLVSAVVKAVTRSSRPVRATSIGYVAERGLDASEHEVTDRYASGSSLRRESGLDEAETTRRVGATATRAARLARLIEDSFAGSGLVADSRDLSAMVRACERAIDFERTVDPGPGPQALSAAEGDGVFAVSGDLRRVALDQVFQLCTHLVGIARCRIEQDEGAVDIYFKDGDVIFARQENLTDGFKLGRLLVASGIVDHQQVEASIDPRSGLSGWLGQRLIRAGYVTEADVRRALVRQTEELVYEAVRWMVGRFVVHADAAMPVQAANAGIRLPFHHLLLEGMRRLDEWVRLSGEVGGLGSVIRRVDRMDTGEILAALMPEERLVLERLKGVTTVRELVRAVPRPTYDVLRAIHRLANHHLVRVRAANV